MRDENEFDLTAPATGDRPDPAADGGGTSQGDTGGSSEPGVPGSGTSEPMPWWFHDYPDIDHFFRGGVTVYGEAERERDDAAVLLASADEADEDGSSVFASTEATDDLAAAASEGADSAQSSASHTLRVPVTIKHEIAPPPPEPTPDDLVEATASGDGAGDDGFNPPSAMVSEADPALPPSTGLTWDDGRDDRDPALADDFAANPDPWEWTIYGTDEAEILLGTEGNDVIFGDRGDDIINALGGDDRIDGYHDDDTINGGAGDDTIRGHDGDDSLTGGEGADVFEFNESPGVYWNVGTDIITDFNPAEDRIRFVDHKSDFFDPAGGSTLGDVLSAVQGADGAELWAENVDLGLMKIAVLQGVDAELIQSMILDETILA